MGEIVRTNDVAVISAVEGLLLAAGIPCFVADRDMSVIDGLINAIQMRVLVPTSANRRLVSCWLSRTSLNGSASRGLDFVNGC